MTSTRSTRSAETTDDADDSTGASTGQRPRTLTVLLLLLLAAGMFSYLGAYAVSDALVSADVLKRWPAGSDPRPRWMLTSFTTVLAASVVAGGAVRILSRRHLRQIDAIAD